MDGQIKETVDEQPHFLFKNSKNLKQRLCNIKSQAKPSLAQLIATTTTKTTTTPEGLSTTPKLTECKPVSVVKSITKNACRGYIEETSCSGVCPSQSWFNQDTQKMESVCACCVPRKWRKKEFALKCPKSKPLILKISVITECECSYDVCKKHH
ncbi:submaxillary mucin-like protein [Protopterus annectens]|uniref:submaxillary mucin-like protein n=1 Tax=Protopterus annectens TaxID=7888 RepID=UPI001CFA5594|nr:submaxillary mucin-like protein [Protopterus annectens]